ncbi:major facilitator superfamily MFS_1 [Pseudodesulfovibrio mercurii]|uniref:Major facilitator superfamily MFS_1 n=1 Tax=Pseudodesulfovibrio mercurii TaxID=641491 RepID=F0JII8_9BACT|nr:MFS transporter [Pseudodesulfovibrio mercurii]EGB15422.1 major facilitator superfamily MFS_1 [Pseudodesulfovibrio mercurii]
MDENTETMRPGDGPADRDDARPRQERHGRFLMILAFFALSVNMRAAITSLPPIIQELRALFDISGGFAGFLTSIPVLCFGLLTPLVGYCMKGIRLETSVFATLMGLVLGSVLRSTGGIGLAVAGTVVIGVSLTMGNIAALLVIGREFPQRIGAMTGLYVCGMSCGSMGTMALTAPLSHGLGWRYALAFPAALALVGLGLWLAVVVERRKAAWTDPRAAGDTPAQKTGPGASPAPSASVLRRPLVWLLSSSFAAHTFLFYGLTAWLPVYLEQTLSMTDARAGLVASLFQLLGLLGSFGLPLLAGTQRFADRGLFLVVTLAWLLTAAGFWLAPAWWVVWVLCGGVSSGGGFTVIFSMIMNHAKDLNENRSMSTVVQTAGYIVAAASPFAVGHLREVSGGWQSGMILLVCASVIMILCGLAATRPKNA